MKQSWDIFCKIVDNFGDIGVCWRLANQLHSEHGLQIRLFVDRLEVACKILPSISNESIQTYKGVSIVRWDEETRFDSAADVVIETFACGLPDAYLACIGEETVWVNVDYLSAEDWVLEFHGLNGWHQQASRLRHFFFPGFATDTGGLLREDALINARDDFLQSEQQMHHFWQALSIDEHATDIKISLFSYANAPLEPFLQYLTQAEQKVSVFMPVNRELPASLFGHATLSAGGCIALGAVRLYLLPFLSQAAYDQLLWACDINFVRGEDSWVRAVWAGRPFIWQPYWQTDNAHLLKLNAFLDKFYGQTALKKTLTSLHQDWSTGAFRPDVWRDYMANLTVIAQLTKKQSKLLIQQKALTNKLVEFCAKLAN